MTKTNVALLECVELDPRVPARSSVIWLHGLGADGNDFVPIVGELEIPRELGVRFVFPHAPVIPVTLNGGMAMRAWYDIVDLDPRTRHDERGVRRAHAELEALIAREKERGVPASRIVLAGFSQGGAIAIHTAVRHRERLAGLMALSTYLVLGDTLGAEASPANRDLPILQVHGLYDPTVLYERGVRSCELLRAAGYAVDFKSYPMQHEVCLPEIGDVSAFLRRVLA
jgi:phospholipase/carboxylesterase